MTTNPTTETAVPRHCKRCGIRIVGESVSFTTQGLDGDFCSVQCLETALAIGCPITPPEPQAGATPDLAAIQGVAGMPAKIITSHIYPPIPIRAYDWVAYFDGQEEGLHGEGPTEEAAIKDLREQVACNQGETQCGTCLDELHFGRRISEMVHKAETKCMECGMMLCGEHARLHFKANGKPLPCENLQVANEAIEMLTEHTATLEAALATSRAETEVLKQQIANDSWTAEMQRALELIPTEFVQNDMWYAGIGRMAERLATLTATLAQREAEIEKLTNNSCNARSWLGLHRELEHTKAARDTALARVRELEAAMDELKRRLNALETDVYKYQNQCDPEEAIPAYITGEIERISKSASDAAARAAGKGEEGAGV